MRTLAGTSGFSYDEWRGAFYPQDLPAGEMLGFYASKLTTVEINNTFYQMPKTALLERWRDAVPDTFRFALKAPRRISHVLRLKNAEEATARLLETASVLGEKLGPILFQLPPFAKKDAVLLGDFLALIPNGARVAFEFRNPSWFDDETFALLAGRGAALCGGDADDDQKSPPLVKTADFGYLRLRAPSYDRAGLLAWADRIAAQAFADAFVYFKHEAYGPLYAAHLAAHTAGLPEPPLPAPDAALPPPIARKPRRPAKKKPT